MVTIPLKWNFFSKRPIHELKNGEKAPINTPYHHRQNIITDRKASQAEHHCCRTSFHRNLGSGSISKQQIIPSAVVELRAGQAASTAHKHRAPPFSSFVPRPFSAAGVKFENDCSLLWILSPQSNKIEFTSK